jgi:type II secretory pathway pseudopilin PulG
MQRMQHISFSRKSEQGLTIVELTIVLVIMGLLMPILFVFLVNSYKDSFVFDAKVKSTAEMKQALWFMEDNIRVASAFQTGISSPFTDFYGPRNNGNIADEKWSYKGNSASSRVLITKNYATNNGNVLDEGRKPVYINTPEFNCTTQMVYQPQLSYVSIYFINNSSLYRRVLTDRTTAVCPGNVQRQKQSCPPYIVSRDASCQANDELLVKNVSAFTVNYFQITSDSTSIPIDANYTSEDPDILSTSDYVNVTITTSTRNGTQTNTMQQRMTKVNQ